MTYNDIDRAQKYNGCIGLPDTAKKNLAAKGVTAFLLIAFFPADQRHYHGSSPSMINFGRVSLAVSMHTNTVHSN